MRERRVQVEVELGQWSRVAPPARIDGSAYRGGLYSVRDLRCSGGTRRVQVLGPRDRTPEERLAA